ncbi:MAG TPA: AAA family ATPase [Methylomirabilota bacterium]|nr:AAA family ATPase [Methylomirabilota bacterium]
MAGVAPASPSEIAERQPAAERRVVSVLFCDLVSFTALAETMDPEDVREIQARYFEAARSVVARYGGVVEKFIGDAVMAVWGAPIAHGDDAERAVRAALEIVGAVRGIGGIAFERRLAARAAVATGEVAVTLGAEGQGMVSGDLVNTAARLESVAPAGGVLVTDATRRAAGAAVDYAPIGRQLLKGKAASVGTWRVVGLAGDDRAGAGHPGPFLGRDVELATLVAHLDATMRDGRSRLVSVLGIAGIGKSRLAWEFGRHLDGIDPQVTWHSGRAPAYGDGITFAPLAEMLRRRARIAEGEVSEVARRKLEFALAELVPDEAERAWLAPRLAILLEPMVDATFDRDELFAAWRRFFERVAERAPTVLIFEDLQWADPGVVDFIEHLVEWAHHHPILIVTLARPELLDQRPTWGASARSFTGLHLDRLPDEAIERLLRELDPALTPSLARRIVQRAEGIPLYAVEMVRMLLDRGMLDTGDGYRLVEPPGALELPASLHALVAARIDTLSPPDRSLLLTGAVLGRRFHPDALAAVTGVDLRGLRPRLDVLLRRDLVSVDDDPGSPGRGQISFVQDVVREVAYRTLSRRERRALHLAAARYLDSLGDEELVEALAGHLVHAHQAEPSHADAAATALRARDTLGRAGRRALVLHSPERAADHFEQALALAGTDGERAELLAEAAASARLAARFEIAEAHLREHIAHAATAGDTTVAGRATAQLASLLLQLQRNDSALAELERATTAIDRRAPDPATAELAAQLARAQMLRGAYDDALAWAQRALDDARALNLGPIATDVLVTRGTTRWSAGSHEEGLADLREAIDLARAGEQLSTELRARNNLAWLSMADDPHVTFETAVEGARLATEMGVGDMMLQLAEVAASAALETGDWERAVALIAEIEPTRMAASHRIDFALLRATYAALRGDVDPAAPIDELGPLPPDTDQQLIGAVAVARSWIAFAAGDHETARRLADEAASASLGVAKHDALALAVRCCVRIGDAAGAAERIDSLERLELWGRTAATTEEGLRAALSALTGEAAEARAAFGRATAALRAIGLPLRLGLTLADQHLVGAGGRQTRSQALATLRALGADGLVAPLEANEAPVSGRAAARPQARSHRPSGRTAPPTGAGRRRRPGTHRSRPAG